MVVMSQVMRICILTRVSCRSMKEIHKKNITRYKNSVCVHRDIAKI